MSWLEEFNKDRIFIYKDSRTGDVFKGTTEEFSFYLGVEIKGEPGDFFEHQEGSVYTYAGFEPKEMSLGTQVTFEHNGRKGRKYGSNGFISETKLQYMKTGQTKTVLSDSYKREMNKRVSEYTTHLEKDQKKWEKSQTKGSVSMAKTKE